MEDTRLWCVGYSIIGILVVALFFFFWSWFQVDQWEVGFIKRFGQVQESLYTPGFYFKKPLIEDVVVFDLRQQKAENTVSAASKDLQSVSAVVAVNYSVKQENVKSAYTTVGNLDAINERIVSPSIQESVKAVTARYTAEELITKRQTVSTEIIQQLRDKLEKYWLNVQEVNIINFEFSKQFEQAIESKVKAEQEALAERNNLEKVKFQAQQTIETEKAKAEAIRIQAQAITSQGWSEFVKMKRIEKWNGVLPATMFGWDSSFIVDLKK